MDWKELESCTGSCTHCGLCETRHNVVFGIGNREADVMFVGEGERIELKHQAHTREVFIAGVIRAIRYIPNAELGIVSSMNDVLGLE